MVWFHRYSKLLAGVSFLLVMAGGLVTSTGSGLAVPDWPLSYGQWLPPMVGGVRYEHTHRLLAALTGLMTLILALWALWVEKRRWFRWVAIGALGAVVAQGILGGVAVLYLLPAPVSIVHACLAQTFLGLVVAISFFTSREWMVPKSFSGDLARLKVLASAAVAGIYLELILGATIRHTDYDFLVVPHIVMALVVLILSVLVLGHVFKEFEGQRQFITPALFLAAFSLLQISFGMGAFVYRWMLRNAVQLTLGKILFVTGHQTLGAVLLSAAVFFALRVFRMSGAAVASSR